MLSTRRDQGRALILQTTKLATLSIRSRREPMGVITILITERATTFQLHTHNNNLMVNPCIIITIPSPATIPNPDLNQLLNNDKNNRLLRHLWLRPSRVFRLPSRTQETQSWFENTASLHYRSHLPRIRPPIITTVHHPLNPRRNQQPIPNPRHRPLVYPLWDQAPLLRIPTMSAPQREESTWTWTT